MRLNQYARALRHTARVEFGKRNAPKPHAFRASLNKSVYTLQIDER